MANVCLKCKFSEVSEFDSPCTTCSYDAKTDKWSNFTPYKGLNELLREKLGYPTPVETVVHDPVYKPNHYMLKPGLEVRDVIEILANKLEGFSPMFIADYVQMMQYGMRFMDKNGKEDLLKQRWYLDKMIEAYDGDS